MGDLAGTIRDYEIAIDRALEAISLKGKKIPPDEVLGALFIRDAVAAEIVARAVTDATVLARLADQDNRLKASARKLHERLGRRTLQSWREAAHRGDDTWWWSLDKRAEAEKSWGDLISMVSAWLLIALSLSFSLEIVRRYLNGGADFTSTVLQGVIALIAGSAIFRGARRFAEGAPKPFSDYAILSTHKSRWIVVILLMALAAALVGTRRLAAHRYNDQGVEEYENKRLTHAIENYRHAISLDPALAEAHFNLGNAYEDVLQYDKAINEYTEAILADQDFYRPYNNLARLYILHRDDYLGALKLIDKALMLRIDPAEANADNVQYALYKNRAWANIGLKNYRQAQKDLAQALVKRPDGISAHCLLAQTLEVGTNQEGALAEWKACGDLADRQKKGIAASQRYDVDEPENDWLETAKERLGGK